MSPKAERGFVQASMAVAIGLSRFLSRLENRHANSVTTGELNQGGGGSRSLYKVKHMLFFARKIETTI